MLVLGSGVTVKEVGSRDNSICRNMALPNYQSTVQPPRTSCLKWPRMLSGLHLSLTGFGDSTDMSNDPHSSVRRLKATMVLMASTVSTSLQSLGRKLCVTGRRLGQARSDRAERARIADTET